MRTCGTSLFTNDKFLQISVSLEIPLRQPADRNDKALLILWEGEGLL